MDVAGPLDADRLLIFATVARERGFSAAARKLGRSQPSVSQAVAALESELGQRLFTREARAVEPTHAGRVLLEHAERVLDEMTRARARIAGLSELREGSLAIGTTDTLACHVLPPVLGELRRRYPRIEIRIETKPSPAIAERVAARELDVGVVTAPLPSGLRVAGKPIAERLAIEELAPYEDVVVAPAEHPLASRARVRLEHLADVPLVLLDRTTASRAFLDAELARRGIEPRVAMETSSVEVLLRLVELGFGVAVAPAVAARPARGRVSVPLVSVGRARSLAVAWPSSPAEPSRAAAELVRLARARLSRSSV